MKYFLLALMLGMTSAVAMAEGEWVSSVNGLNMKEKLEGNHEVSYDCHFRSSQKKGATCTARGEVCVNFGGKEEKEGRKCDSERDDNRLRITCSNGFRDDDRARGFIRREGGQGTDLVIESKGRDADRIEVEEFDRFDGNNDRDDNLRSKLTFDNKRGDSRDGEFAGTLWGRCRVRLERENTRLN